MTFHQILSTAHYFVLIPMFHASAGKVTGKNQHQSPYREIPSSGSNSGVTFTPEPVVTPIRGTNGFQLCPVVPSFPARQGNHEQHRPLQASNSMFNNGLEVENKITYMMLITICPLRAFLRFSNIK